MTPTPVHTWNINNLNALHALLGSQVLLFYAYKLAHKRNQESRKVSIQSRFKWLDLVYTSSWK